MSEQGDDMTPVDRIFAAKMCQYMKKFDECREQLMDKTDRWGATRHREIRETVLQLCSLLGVTKRYRRELEVKVTPTGEEQGQLDAVRKNQGRGGWQKRTSLDDMTPEKLGVKKSVSTKAEAEDDTK
jgi:hypothetical protein